MAAAEKGKKKRAPLSSFTILLIILVVLAIVTVIMSASGVEGVQGATHPRCSPRPCSASRTPSACACSS